MSKLQETKKKSQRIIIALVIIGFSVYLGFTPLFELIQGGVAGAVVGASFGAIFVIVLTMYLLNQQTEIEQESKKSERVFDEKVKLYQFILNVSKDMVEDEVLTREEIMKLPFAMINLQMIGGDKTIKAFQDVFSKINNVYSKNQEDNTGIDDEERVEILKILSTFATQCRIDLGISDTEIDQKLFDDSMQTIEAAISSKNAPVDSPVTHSEEVIINNDEYRLDRHSTGQVRAFKNKEIIKRNTKAVFRLINDELNLGFSEADIKDKHTSQIGKLIIEKINQRK